MPIVIVNAPPWLKLMLTAIMIPTISARWLPAAHGAVYSRHGGLWATLLGHWLGCE
ncbi:MAG: hypothetical protein H0X26_03465 [Alphaproteobacteria bacterium]|nr:hypothetical protein [Alphaproteobacteria bacterium]